MMNTEPFDILEYVLKNVPRKDAMNYLKTAFFNLVMEEEACLQAHARKYEHAEERVAHRNGYKERTVLSKDGPLVLKKPQFREFSFQTTLFDLYDRVEKAVALGIAESYVQGISTRRMRTIMDKFGMAGVSASTASRLCEELDEKTDELLNRRIDTPCWRLMVDASYYKVREDSRYANKALLIMLGIREDDCREVLGARVADSENQLFREDLFQSLQDRGPHDVKLVVSDGHTGKGIQGAVKTCFQGAGWQMCHVHLHRAVLRKTPLKYQKEVSIGLSEAPENPLKIDVFAHESRKKGLGRASETIERFRYDLLNYQAYPKEI